jgi:hypothetical protein
MIECAITRPMCCELLMLGTANWSLLDMGCSVMDLIITI